MKYDPPTRNRKGKLRLDFNENTIGCSSKVIEVIRKVDFEDISVYPEYGDFIKKLANYLNVEESEILLTNGADEGIKIIMDSFLEKDDEIIMPCPTFAMFNVCADNVNARLTEILYNQDLSFPTQDFLDRISDSTKMVILVNPNNPTGTAIERKDIISIIEKAKNSIVVIDEAYFQFYGKTCKDLIKKYSNVVVLQTFSKAFGLAGLRLGYIIANDSLLRKLNASPYSVNTLAIIAGKACLDDLDFVENYVSEVKSSKNFVKLELNKIGIKTFDSQANFLVADFGDKCNLVCDELRKKGILVRNRTNYPLLKGCLRIGIGTRKQCEELLVNMKDILAKKVLLFDLDGVLADVSNSYRIAIKKTAEYFLKKKISSGLIQEIKQEGGFNNDWILTNELIKRNGIEISFDLVKSKFQELYLGGLIDKEELVISRKLLDKLEEDYILGIVTGRPKEEAIYFLEKTRIKDMFSTIVCMEDYGEEKYEGIRLALQNLGAKESYFFGDAVDDMIAAKKAGIIPIGVIPPKMDEDLENVLLVNGGVKVIRINEILEAIR